MQCPCSISRKNWVRKLMFCMLINMKVFYKLIELFDGFYQACPKHIVKFAMYLWHLKNEIRNEVWNLTALAGSSTTLAIYYTCNVLPSLTLFISQYGIHAKPFLYLINCLCNRSLLLYEWRDNFPKGIFDKHLVVIILKPFPFTWLGTFVSNSRIAFFNWWRNGPQLEVMASY